MQAIGQGWYLYITFFTSHSVVLPHHSYNSHSLSSLITFHSFSHRVPISLVSHLSHFFLVTFILKIKKRNFQRFISVPVSIKCLSWSFDIGDPRSGQFYDLSIICKSMEENEMQLFWANTIKNTFKHRVTGRLDTLSRNFVTSDPSPCR